MKNTKIKNLLAKMIYELYAPDNMPQSYEEADIPTRNCIDKYLPKINVAFLEKLK